jgi:hypothetical protein
MCLPSPPKAPKPPPPAPKLPDEGVQMARSEEQRRLRAMAGRQSTIRTQGDLLGRAETTGGGNLLGG